MKTPWFVRSALCCLLLVATAHEARADGELMVQRRDYLFASYFELMRDSVPLGTVVRHRAKHPIVAAYELYDASGELVASAQRSLWGLSNLACWAARLDFYDADRNRLGALIGSVWTTERARFRLVGEDNEPVAILWLDRHATSIIATAPNSAQRVLARLARQQPSDLAYQRWEISNLEVSPVPDAIWALIGAFASDTWNSRDAN